MLYDCWEWMLKILENCDRGERLVKFHQEHEHWSRESFWKLKRGVKHKTIYDLSIRSWSPFVISTSNNETTNANDEFDLYRMPPNCYSPRRTFPPLPKYPNSSPPRAILCASHTIRKCTIDVCNLLRSAAASLSLSKHCRVEIRYPSFNLASKIQSRVHSVQG